MLEAGFRASSKQRYIGPYADDEGHPTTKGYLEMDGQIEGGISRARDACL